jgi:hypothetical protein
MRSRADRATRAIGFVLGAGLAITALLSWKIPPGHATLGADVTVVSHPSGELAVSPNGRIINATALKPGPPSAAEGSHVKLHNQTDTTLDVRLRGVPSESDLDDALMVDVTSGGESLFRGSLGDFRSWTPEGISIDSGAQAGFQISTWLPPTLAAGYQGRSTTVDLELRSTPADDR